MKGWRAEFGIGGRFIGFDEDLRSVAGEDGEEGIAGWLLKRGFKAEFAAVEGDGSFDVADDKKGAIAAMFGRIIGGNAPAANRFHPISRNAEFKVSSGAEDQLICLGLVGTAEVVPCYKTPNSSAQETRRCMART